MSATQAVEAALAYRDDQGGPRPKTDVSELTLGQAERQAGGAYSDPMVPESRCAYEVTVDADRTFHEVGQLKVAHQYVIVFDVATGNEFETIGRLNAQPAG